MKLSLAGRSLILFGVSLFVVLASTLLDPVLGALSFTVQRVIIFVGIVLPALAGAALGVMSLVRRQGRIWLAVTGVVLNTLFALFYLALMLFAG